MGRWPGDARERLKAAALEVALEVGWAATTADLVAARAGVSQRTFFRHFADKEEVLFAEDESLRAALVQAVRDAPDGRPLTVVREALLALARLFEPRRAELRARAAVIAQDPALRGRDLVKQAGWAEAAAAELTARGVPDGTARLVTGSASHAFREAFHAWLAGSGETTLGDELRRTMGELAAAVGGPAGTGQPESAARRD